MNLVFRLFLFTLFTFCLLTNWTLAFEDVVDASPFHQGVASDERRSLRHAFSEAGVSDHVILKAAAHGDTRTVLDILRHDPDLLHHANAMGWTSLNFAAANGHVELLRALLEQGADPNHAENDGWTPLMFAAYHGDTESVEILLHYNANPLLVNHREMSAHELSNLQQHFQTSQILGRESVFWALRERDFKKLLAHLEQGVSPNIQNPAGWTPLIAAVDAGDTETATHLLDVLHADVNLQEQDGWSPLMFAAFKGDVYMTQLLLNHGANVHLTAHNRATHNTALEMATQNQHHDTVDVLKRFYHENRFALPDSHRDDHTHEEEVKRLEQEEFLREEARERELLSKEHLNNDNNNNINNNNINNNINNNNNNKHHINNNKKKRGGTGFFNW